MYDNQFTGTLPNNLKLGNIFYLDIGRNYISGSIPDDIGTDYGELKYLHIDHNRLTGSIPNTIPLMANGRMISFLADHNKLSGTVPDNWIMFNKLVQYTIQGTSSKLILPNQSKIFQKKFQFSLSSKLFILSLTTSMRSIQKITLIIWARKIAI